MKFNRVSAILGSGLVGVLLAATFSAAEAQRAPITPSPPSAPALNSAASRDALSVQLTGRKVVMGITGSEKFEGADSAKPGDVIEYVAAYRNTSALAIPKLSATLPVPEGTGLVAGTARPPLELASLDGVTYAPVPLKRQILDPATGQKKTVDVPLSEYKSLRWTFASLPAGKVGNVAARVRLDTNDTPVASASTSAAATAAPGRK